MSKTSKILIIIVVIIIIGCIPFIPEDSVEIGETIYIDGVPNKNYQTYTPKHSIWVEILKKFNVK